MQNKCIKENALEFLILLDTFLLSFPVMEDCWCKSLYFCPHETMGKNDVIWSVSISAFINSHHKKKSVCPEVF